MHTTTKKPISGLPHAGLALGLSVALAACGGGDGGPPPVTVSVTGDSVVPANGSGPVTATVANDAGNGGVTWTVTCPMRSCGVVSPATTASGIASTYTAPAYGPSDIQVTITATSVDSPAASGVLHVNVSAGGVGVSVSALGTTSVPAGSTTQLTATLDVNASGNLTWTASCAAASCGSISPTRSASGAAVIYTAPTVPPTGDLAVNITATTTSTPPTQGSLGITIPAIAVSVAPVSALLPLNISEQFAATARNDDTSKGVTWALSQNGAPCSPACGTVVPSATASGSPTAYTAPASLPANPIVILTATSVIDPTKSVPATVTLTVGSMSLVPADLTLSRGSARQVAVLTNTSSSPVTISGIVIGGTSPGDFTEANNCGAGLAPRSSCQVTVTYPCAIGPTSLPSCKGTHTAVLSIADNSPDSPQQLHLTGVGKAAAAAALRAALRAQLVAIVPRPTGASNVGTRVMRLLDTARDDPYLANGTKRELMVRFWYPASGNSSCTPAEYTSAGTWSEFAQLLGTTLPQVMTNSCLNVAVADGAHPVVVVSPGFTGTFTDYTFLTEDLASRGYVVASVDHTYEATAVEFPDGRLEKGVFGSYLTRYARSDPQALAFAVSVRIDDLRFVLNELGAFNGGRDGMFAGKLDLSRMALAGHSLGGLTTVRGVQHDARFRAGISLDGLVPDRLTLPTSTPVLLVRAGGAQWNENDCQLWGALQGVHMALNLNGVEHIALSDAVWLGNGVVGTGAMGVEKTIASVRMASAAFLDAIFTGAAPDSIAGSAFANDPNVTVITQNPSGCTN